MTYVSKTTIKTATPTAAAPVKKTANLAEKAAPAKKIVKRRAVTAAMPTLVDNPHVGSLNDLLGFTAGKAAAVANHARASATAEYTQSLLNIRTAAALGKFSLTLSDSTRPTTLASLRAAGYTVRREKCEDDFGWLSVFSKPTFYNVVVW